MTVRVSLSQVHIDYSDDIARKRHENAKANNIKGGNGGPEAKDGDAALEIDILGARGECAAYLWLKPIEWHRYHKGADFTGLPDLGALVDVKTVDRAGKCLLLQPNAHADWIYLLVNAARHPEYEICGWMWGSEAKRDRFLRTVGGRTGYFVPASELRSPASLKELLPREE